MFSPKNLAPVGLKSDPAVIPGKPWTPAGHPPPSPEEQITIPQLDGGHGLYHAQTWKGASEWHLQRAAEACYSLNLFYPLQPGQGAGKGQWPPRVCTSWMAIAATSQQTERAWLHKVPRCAYGGGEVVPCHGTHNGFATAKVLGYLCEPLEPSNNRNRTIIDIFKNNCAG